MSNGSQDEMIIVSACLAGVRCVNYPSGRLEDEIVKELVAAGKTIPLCSEQLGGLPTPRPSAGFLGDGAEGFWTGSGARLTRVVSIEGDNLSEPFLQGPREIPRLARLAGATKAILHDGSPSCGVTKTTGYDKDGHLVHWSGPGAVAWLLRSHGVGVFTPESWQEEHVNKSS